MAVQTDERLQHVLTGARQQFLGVAHIDEATRDNIRASQGLACLFINCEHHHQDAVLSQHLAVTQDNLPDVTDAKAVYKDIAAGGMILYLYRVRGDFNDITIFSYYDM